jgi:CheY-like chemotaxis protein
VQATIPDHLPVIAEKYNYQYRMSERTEPIRVLVAEDHPPSSEMLSRILSEAGLEVRVAQNGEEALHQAQCWHPDLIWMDMNMPVMDGYEATRRLKENEPTRHIPIAALTASAFEEDRKRILDCGCDEFLRKPFSVEELFEAMEDLLDITFDREDLEVCTGAGPVTASQIDLATLTAEEREALSQAVVNMEAASLRDLAVRLQSKDAALASLIKRAVDELNFEPLLGLIKKEGETETG